MSTVADSGRKIRLNDKTLKQMQEESVLCLNSKTGDIIAYFSGNMKRAYVESEKANAVIEFYVPMLTQNSKKKPDYLFMKARNSDFISLALRTI